jgi:Ca2+:H+ antiporter
VLKPSLDWLLMFVPAAIAIRLWPGEHAVPLFICSLLAIVPLAGRIGTATEALASDLGHGVGALLNASFGNAAELIIALFALSKNLTDIVKASITGSIIGNALLVLGISMFAGGLKYPVQRFNTTAVRSSTTSLMLAAVALLIPTVFHQTAALHRPGWSAQTEQNLSLAIAIVLCISYAGTLVFTLMTHRELFTGGEPGEPRSRTRSGGRRRGHGQARSVAALLGATALIALMSEFMVSTVEAARIQFGFTELFTGVVVVAIVGNAAEHSTAVSMAMKNKLDLSLGVTIGSSLQIALFVTPVLVFASYIFGRPMNLEFTIPEIVAVLVSVVIVAQISGDGESNWLEGLLLLSLYAILAILFFFLPAAA